MLGKPKYHVGDLVEFNFNGNTLTGLIAIVEAYGTLEQNKEPSYDIEGISEVNGKREPCLYKHCTESNIMIKGKFIPSKSVREYMRENGFTFSKEEACTIYTQVMKLLQDSHDSLSIMSYFLDNEDLKKDILDYISKDEGKLKRFIEQVRDCFFAVYTYEENYSEEGGVEVYKGLFKTYTEALKYGISLDKDFVIEKKYLLKVVNVIENLEDGITIGEIRFNSKGQIKDYWYHEKGELEVIELFQSEQRKNLKFDHAYISIPNPFTSGDIIKNVNGIIEEHGIVESFETLDDWLQFDNKMKSMGNNVDFTDTYTTVEFLNSNGRFTHKHICPLFLEYYDIDDVEETLEIKTLKATGSSMKNNIRSLRKIT